MVQVGRPPRAGKAERLVAEGNVREVTGLKPRAFNVTGDNGLYLVTAFSSASGDYRGAFCTCPATKTCSHVLAVQQVMLREQAAKPGYDPFDGIGATH